MIPPDASECTTVSSQVSPILIQSNLSRRTPAYDGQFHTPCRELTYKIVTLLFFKIPSTKSTLRFNLMEPMKIFAGNNTKKATLTR